MDLPARMRCIDSHTAGEPTRVVIDGLPDLKGDSVAEKAADFADRFAGWRRAILAEPRGSEVLVGALLLDDGVIFFNNVGVLGMCGHGTIGVVETLRWLGRISAGTVALETPVGTVSATLHESGEVSVQNIPSYRHASGVTVGGLTGEVAYGGNWFYIAPSPIPLVPANIAECMALTVEIRKELERSGITGAGGAEIDHVELYEPSPTPGVAARNFVLCPGLEFDRSPCGTGTSAKLACMVAEGHLAPGEEFVVESITGGIFRGVAEDLGNGTVKPTITGRAYVVAETTLHFDPEDPYRGGLPR